MSGSPDGPARRPGGALFVALSTLVAAVVGLVLGGVAGGVLYEVAGPRSGQLGDLESLRWVITGALAGGVVCAILAGVLAGRVRHEPRGRARLGAVLGTAFAGTAGGLATFPPTASRWVVPVVSVAAITGLLGGVIGARLAAAGLRSTRRG